jgi:hydroxyacylglutathione hydrolase
VHQCENEARSPLYLAAESDAKDCRSMLEIVPLPAFRDNYIWTLRDERHAAVVDPGEAHPVLEYLAHEKLTLTAILATHHHPDHVGGIPELLRRGPVPVYGPKREPIATLTNPVAEGDTVEIPELGLALSVLDIPGHTRAHVAYYGAGSLFCGDTLFACGCGRLFEGTAEQMMASLGKLARLPDDTKVYCGHEYTLANIAFAQQVEPANAALAERLAQAKAQRAAGKPTLPSTLGEERASNPFLRWAEPAVIDSANKYLGSRVSDPVKVFSAIREWKNRA